MITAFMKVHQPTVPAYACSCAFAVGRVGGVGSAAVCNRLLSVGSAALTLVLGYAAEPCPRRVLGRVCVVNLRSTIATSPPRHLRRR